MRFYDKQRKHVKIILNDTNTPHYIQHKNKTLFLESAIVLVRLACQHC